MKNLHTTSIVITLISALVFSGMALAGHHKGGNMLKRMAHHLELDTAQTEQAEAIQAELRPQMQELYEQRRSLKKALGEAVRNGASQSEIDELARQQGDNYAQLVSKRAELKSRFNALLTDDQRAKMEEMREHRMERKQHRKEKRRERREERLSADENV